MKRAEADGEGWDLIVFTRILRRNKAMEREKRTRRGVRIVFFLLVTLGVLLPALISVSKRSFYGGVRVFIHAMRPEKIVCQFKDIYSPDVRVGLVAFLKEYAQDNSIWAFQKDLFCQQLKQKFSIIKSIECHIEGGNNVIVSIEGVIPQYLVNNKFILGDTKRLYSLDYFKTFICDRLANIRVPENLCNPEKESPVYDFLCCMPRRYVEQFDVSYLKSSCICLQPKACDAKYMVIVDEASLFDDVKINRCSKIFDDIVQRGMLSKKTQASKGGNAIVLDLRFPGRIVVKFKDSLKRGGRS